MKLELRKEEKIDGKVFFCIFVDTKIIQCFLVSDKQKEFFKLDLITEAEIKAREFFNKIKERGTHESIITVIQSETL